MEAPKERLGKIKETVIPELEELESKLDVFIRSRPDLTAKIEVIKSPHFKTDNLISMIQSWNKENSAKLIGYYVERKFCGRKGEILKIRMDVDGNVMLLGDLSNVKK